jgi:hypothetical protein
VVSSCVLEPAAPGTRPEKNFFGVPAPGIDLAKSLKSQRTWKELPVLSFKKTNSLRGLKCPEPADFFGLCFFENTRKWMVL